MITVLLRKGEKMPRTKEVIVLYADDGIGNSIGEIVGEVVRCKDCFHFWDGVCKAHIDVIDVDDNDFCSWGERREDEAD